MSTGTSMRYWCFDDETLERALAAWTKSAAPGDHPEARATAESAAAAVRAFLTAPEARESKMLNEIAITLADELRLTRR